MRPASKLKAAHANYGNPKEGYALRYDTISYFESIASMTGK